MPLGSADPGAQLDRSVDISFQQLQKYKNAKNRVSASMLYEIARSQDHRFEGLPGKDEYGEPQPLPVDERIGIIASAEARRCSWCAGLHPAQSGCLFRVPQRQSAYRPRVSIEPH
ncbi:hypothetical protein CN311_05095 [Mesorhizobium sanjuanii]|uniref:Uncharacterized protein n=1 Tax=Mesorhizobium sanjuanii TaxID=2037900 RepID=A0A2A6FJZ4_9HYPH|nr:hypothetical protein [Mesorhizobium sanjuanii]PDQ22269.1 hypothetical protein CN311_05095 [Mesorhizobium sanjuanii]